MNNLDEVLNIMEGSLDDVIRLSESRLSETKITPVLTAMTKLMQRLQSEGIAGDQLIQQLTSAARKMGLVNFGDLTMDDGTTRINSPQRLLNALTQYPDLPVEIEEALTTAYDEFRQYGYQNIGTNRFAGVIQPPVRSTLKTS